MRRLFGLIFLVSVMTLVSAQGKVVTYLDDPSWNAPEKLIDITHMNANLKINPYDTLVLGEVSFTFLPMRAKVDSVVFWAPDIMFDDVTLKSRSIRYNSKNDNLVIYFDDPLPKETPSELIMKYKAKPKYDLFLIGWNEPALRENKQIWAHRPFHWLPYYGDRLTVDMFVTFDKNYLVFSNGVRESVKENKDGTKTWHYKMYKEHPFFSTALVIGNYKYKESMTGNGLPLEFWYYPWQEDHLEPTYRYTELMFDFLDKELGFDYPYELYREAPVEDYLYGAMETTTSTVFGDYLHVDDRAFDLRNYVNVNIHELTHQWFGNCLSHLRGRDVWLTESFATYYAKLFEKEVFGDDYYQQVRDQEMTETFEASAKDGYPVGDSRGGRARWYPKGSLMLDMLRDVIGEEDFKASVKYYIEHHSFSEVETNDFLASIHHATGRSMEWFFDEWIYRGGEPEYQVSWNKNTNGSGIPQTAITIQQIQPLNDLTGLFKMPVVSEVFYDDGTFDKVEQWLSKEYEEVNVPNPDKKNVSFILFDPGRKILKKVTFVKSFEEWSSQAIIAPDMIDRYDAYLALRQYPVDRKKELLLACYTNEKYHLVRAEIIKQLADPYSPDIELFMRQALNDTNVYVRRAAIEALPEIPEELMDEAGKLLKDQSYVNVEKALNNLCASFPDHIDKFLDMTKDETGWRGRNIRMKWLEIAIGAGQREYLKELTEYASPHYEFETRINAYQLLKRLNYLDETATGYLFDGYLYWNYKVSNAAKEALLYFKQQNEYKSMMTNTLADTWRNDDDVKKIKELLIETK